jgi:hypothetical protein
MGCAGRASSNQHTPKTLFFKLTYATMFNPPEELHTRFDQALVEAKANLGKEYGMIIDGKERFADEKVSRSLACQYGCCAGYIPKRHRPRCRRMP